MTDTLPSCHVVLRTMRPQRRNRWGADRLTRVRPMLRALREGLHQRGRHAVKPRALRRLPRGTWQVRVGVRWHPLENVITHRGPGWLHLQGRAHACCAIAAAGRSGLACTPRTAPLATLAHVCVTIWRHRVPADVWRRLGVAVGDSPK